MVSIVSHIKKDLFGYIALLAFIVFIAASHLLSLAVYFLFLYLFTDICTNEINRKIPALHKTLLFWLMVVIIVAAVAIFVIIISPLFARDFPLYFSLLHDNTMSFINMVSNRFDITIDSKAIGDAVVSESTKSLGFVLKMINHISKELIFFIFAFKFFINTTSGCKDSASHKVYVYPSPKAGFTVNDSIQCFRANSFTFKDTSSFSGAPMTSRTWTFGDGNSATGLSVIHSYTSSNTFLVKLKVGNNSACADSAYHNVYVNPSPTAKFAINDSDQCIKNNLFIFTDNSTITAASISSRLWKFGDATTSTANPVNHSYASFNTFLVKLRVVSNSNCTDSVSHKVYVYPSPKAGFSVNDSIQCFNGNSFSFKDTSLLSTAVIASRLWLFGDGFSATSSTTPVHTYSANGNFTVKLKIISNFGCTDSVSHNMHVYPSSVVKFSPDDTAQCFKNN